MKWFEPITPEEAQEIKDMIERSDKVKPSIIWPFLIVGIIVLISLITLQMGVWLSMPYMYKSTKSKECLYGMAGGYRISCQDIGDKYHVIWVE